ncbi:CheB methylesterase domain-containing protein [Gymnodinialimonas sp. 57CJ19]|uniref:CheB methylesterase domain-containing protein n=1 Tax=Gymnodinialimonas sp. 57CJ19 TaxID=3138498 RepID=UPI00313453CD
MGTFASLTDAYAQTEAQPPDVTICSPCVARRPEFPMFRALLHMIGSAFIAAHTATSAGSIFRALGLNVEVPPPFFSLHSPDRRAAQRVVAIGASTGGVEALTEVLSSYPKDCPPTLIVQHIKPEFLKRFVARLDRNCAAHVTLGQHDMPMRAGTVVFAPGPPSHLTLDPQRMRCVVSQAPPVSGYRPSIDALFNSVAPLRSRAVGVILTGMGRDGVKGLGAIHRADGWTIAQDAATSTVHGMPRLATEQGFAREVLPLPEIGKAILSAASASAAPIQ